MTHRRVLAQFVAQYLSLLMIVLSGRCYLSCYLGYHAGYDDEVRVIITQLIGFIFY